MGGVPTRDDRKKDPMIHDYRISTVIRSESLPNVPLGPFAEKLDEAVYETSANYPAVTHYIVRACDSEIIVGLQIEKVAPDKVENIADALLNDSIELLMHRLELKTAPQIEESELHLV